MAGVNSERKRRAATGIVTPGEDNRKVVAGVYPVGESPTPTPATRPNLGANRRHAMRRR